MSVPSHADTRPTEMDLNSGTEGAVVVLLDAGKARAWAIRIAAASFGTYAGVFGRDDDVQPKRYEIQDYIDAWGRGVA